MSWLLWLSVLVAGVALIVWGAESFAENLGCKGVVPPSAKTPTA